jgi:neutral trehalase
VVGLLKYGFIKDAKRIIGKSLKTHAAIFRKYGTFFEKIDAVAGDQPKDFHYKNQAGFGWTNGVFYRYVKLLDAIESGKNIYSEPKSQEPPYRIAIVH